MQNVIGILGRLEAGYAVRCMTKTKRTLHLDAIFGNGIDMRRRDVFATVKADIAIPHIITHDDNEIRLFRLNSLNNRAEIEQQC